MNNLKNIKNDFPIFKTYPNLVYLDSGATSQKPQEVIDAVSDFYTKKNANIHRGIYKLAEIATEVYENTRFRVSKFINAKSLNEIIFTTNTNHAINLVAYGWARKFLKSGDIIVLSEMEHHANIVPWLRLKEEKGVELIFLPIDKEYRLDSTAGASLQLASKHSRKRYGADYKSAPAKALDTFDTLDTSKIKLIALTHVSNVLGTINPLYKIIPYSKKYTEAKILIDAAQSIPHLPIDVQELGIDFLAFSSHKMLGPTGVGVLWAKEELLDSMDPLLVGSNMIRTVTKNGATWADGPDKFEVGTSNLEGAAGLSAAISYLTKIGMKNIEDYERELTDYALEKLKNISYLTLHGPSKSESRLGIFSFNLKDAHPHDVAQVLDNQNIAIRSGHHCAQITMSALNVSATARASFYLYNAKEDVDKLVEGIGVVKRILKI